MNYHLLVSIIFVNSMLNNSVTKRFNPTIITSPTIIKSYKPTMNFWIIYNARINKFLNFLNPFYSIEKREFFTLNLTKYSIKNEFTLKEEIYMINESKNEDFEKVKEEITESISKFGHNYMDICSDDSFKVFLSQNTKKLNRNYEIQRFYFELLDELEKLLKIYQQIFKLDSNIIYFHISKLKESKSLGLSFSIYLYKKICKIFIKNEVIKLINQKVDELEIFDRLNSFCNNIIDVDPKKLLKKPYIIWRSRSNRIFFCRLFSNIEKIYIFKYIGKLLENIEDQVLVDIIVFCLGQIWYDRKKYVSYDKVSGIIMFLTVYLQKQRLGLIDKNEQRIDFFLMVKSFIIYNSSFKNYSKSFKKISRNLQSLNQFLSTMKLCFICRTKKIKNFDSFYNQLEKDVELRKIFYELFDLQMQIKKKIIFFQ